MTYVIVTIRSINDVASFDEYAARVKPIIERYGGKYVAIEPKPEIKAGEWCYVRTVIVAFPSLEAARAWYDSHEYQQVLPLRVKAITANVVLVRDLSETSAKAA